MRLRRDAWPIRLMGCLFGLGSLALGFFGAWGYDDTTQVSDFALIAIVTGLIALLGSLFTPDIRALWFCNPERSADIARRSGKTVIELIRASGEKK